MLLKKRIFLFLLLFKQFTRAWTNGNPVDQVALKRRSSLWSSKWCTCIIWRDSSSHSYTFSCQSSGSHCWSCVFCAWHEHQAGFTDKNENPLYSGDISWKGLPFQNDFFLIMTLPQTVMASFSFWHEFSGAKTRVSSTFSHTSRSCT